MVEYNVKTFLWKYPVITLIMLMLITSNANSNIQSDSITYFLADRFIGMADAPVTVIDYSSLTCPHCAEFHTQILPKFKENFIDTGKVKFIYRDFSLDAIATLAALISHCTQPDIYFRFLEVLFENQETWAKSVQPREALTTLAKFSGMTEEEINVCLNDENLLNNLTLVKNEARARYNVKSTPSFVIGNHTYIGITSYNVFSTLVEAELEKQKNKSR